MKRQTRNFTAKLKAKVALEAVKENQTMIIDNCNFL